MVSLAFVSLNAPSSHSFFPSTSFKEYPNNVRMNGFASKIRSVVGLMSKIGLGVDVNKSGKNKDMGSPFRESNDEENMLMQKTVDVFAGRFINLVQKHRKLDDASLKEVSTARVFVADDALRLKLIDKIGYIRDAVKETRAIAGLADNARVVVYRRNDIPEDNYYRALAPDASANVALINIGLPEILKARAGFYYLWPGAINFE